VLELKKMKNRLADLFALGKQQHFVLEIDLQVNLQIQGGHEHP